MGKSSKLKEYHLLIFSQSAMPQLEIDYLIIDIEASEFAILKAFDWESH